MAKNKVIIPISAEIDSASLLKATEALKGLATSTSKAVSSASKSQAADLLKLYQTVRQNFEQQMSSGKMSEETEAIFTRTLNKLKHDIAALGRGVSKELKNIDISMFDPAAKEELKELNDGLTESKKKLEDLSQIKIVSFDELVGQDKQKELGIDRFTALTAAYNDLNRQEEKLAKLEGLEKRNKAQEEEYQLLKKGQPERLKYTKIIEDQINANNKYKDDLGKAKTEVKGYEEAIKSLTQEQLKAINATLGFDIKALTSSAPKKIESDAVKTFSERIKEAAGNTTVFGGLMDRAKDSVIGFVTGLVSGKLIIDGIRMIIRETIKVVKELDQAFIEIAMVTTYTTKEVWAMKDSFIAIANTTGLTISQVTKLAGEFFRQGRSYSDVLKLTEAAGVAARIAGISAGDSVNYLTSAINGYQLSASQAMAVSDKFAALAAASATDYEELAIALSKVAAQAYSAGVGMDNMMGFIAKALETTREAPENIGTAFKTIFARMSELKDLGKTVEDGMDIGRVDTALKAIGVRLTDERKELRNLDEVLIDVGSKWQTLNKNQKAYIATALAGTRQQTRLLAVFEDFDRTMELAEISANSLGASLAQQAKYQNSIAYSINQMQVAWQDFVSSLVSSDAFLLFYKTIAGVLNGFNSIIDILGSANAPLLVLGVGLLLLTRSLTKAAMSGAAYNLSQKKIVFESVKQILANTGLGMSFTTLTTFINGATGSLEVFKAALLQSGLGIFILVAGAAAAALIYMATAEERAKKKTEELMESIKKTQADVFNFRKKADDLETLVSKYEDINKSVTKTNADLEEQQSLMKQIQDVIGDEFIVTGIGGELNTSLINAKIQELKDQADIDFQDTVDKAISSAGSISKAYNQAINLNDASAQQFLIIAKAMEHLSETTDGATLSYSEFLDQSQEIIDLETKRANIGLNSVSRVEKYRVTSTAVGDNGERLIDDVYNTKEEAQTLLDYYGDAVRLSIEYEIDEKSAQQTQIEAETFFDSIRAKSFFTEEDAENQARILSGFFELSPEAQAALVKSDASISNIVSALGVLGLGENQSGLDKLTNLLTGTDFNLSQIGNFSKVLEDIPFEDTATRSQVLSDIIQFGPEEAIKRFGESGKSSLTDIIRLTQTMIDTLSTITFESLASSATSLNSTFESMKKINDMLSGEADYDILFMNQMLEQYPMLNDMIAEGNTLTQDQIQQIATAKKQEFLDDLDRKQAEIELTIQNNNLELALLEDMLTASVDMTQLEKDAQAGQEENYIATIEDYQRAYLLQRTENDVEANREAILQRLNDELAAADESEKAFIQARINAIKALPTDYNIADLGFSVDPNVSQQTNYEKAIKDRISTIIADNTRLTQQLTNIENIRRKITASGSLLGNKETTSAKEYEAKLNDIYILEQQLALLQEKLSNYQFAEENAKSGEEWLQSIYSQNAALEAQNTTLNQTIDAQKLMQSSLLNEVSSLSKAYRLIDGRMVPVMSEYNKLSDDQKEALDSAVESYNEYSGSIHENTQQMDENTAAIEKNLQKIEDKTVELYDILANAIRNSEQEKLDILKEGLDEEKKLLDRRRKMYEDAFAEEDYTESLNDINTERQTLITQLSNLEGATDLASVKRRQELLDRKAELDKEYNQLYTDYNREALLESLDNEEQLIDDKQAAYEAEYEERINSVEWMEAEIQRIMKEGRDYTIQYLKDHSTDFSNAWSISKDNIEGMWINLYDIVTLKLEDVASAIPDFSAMLEQLRQAATYVQTIQNSSGGGGGGGSGGGNNTVAAYKATNGKYYTTLDKAVDASIAKFIKDNYGDDPYMNAGRLKAIASQTTSLKASIKKEMVAAGTKVYKKGGIADFTGPAWLDGSKSRPERILSPFQTELFDSMVKALESLSIGTNTNNESINIENITIQTPQLNTNADFASAGKTLAMELKTAIAERGININKKR